MKNFISINEPFICLNCGEKNPKADKTCRNHCRKCLYSLHVDKDTPGDRLSNCRGLMIPLYIDQKSKKGVIIFHKCQKCGKIMPNKTAEDDNREEIINLSKNPCPATETKRRTKKYWKP